jgi:hypothetical protein
MYYAGQTQRLFARLVDALQATPLRSSDDEKGRSPRW